MKLNQVYKSHQVTLCLCFLFVVHLTRSRVIVFGVFVRSPVYSSLHRQLPAHMHALHPINALHPIHAHNQTHTSPFEAEFTALVCHPHLRVGYHTVLMMGVGDEAALHFSRTSLSPYVSSKPNIGLKQALDMRKPVAWLFHVTAAAAVLIVRPQSRCL